MDKDNLLKECYELIDWLSQWFYSPNSRERIENTLAKLRDTLALDAPQATELDKQTAPSTNVFFRYAVIEGDSHGHIWQCRPASGLYRSQCGRVLGEANLRYADDAVPCCSICDPIGARIEEAKRMGNADA